MRSESEVFRLVQELENQKIDLQNQNEEYIHALELLQESEERYRLLHENAGIGIGYYKPDGTIISYNHLAAKFMNGVPEDFDGKSIYDIFPQPEAEFYHNRIRKALSADQPVVYEDLVSLPSGDKCFMSTYTKIEGLNNQILGVQINAQEITERRKVEDNLRESEKKFRQLFKNMTSGVALHEIILNAEGNPCNYRFLEINPAFEKLTGLKSINLIGKTALEVLPSTEPYWIETYGQVALTGKAINFESYSRELCKYFQVNAYSPEPGKFVTIFLDITERRQNEERILLSNSTIQREQLEKETLINSTTDVIWSVDRELRLITANEAFFKDTKALTGWTFKLGDKVLDENLYSSELIAFWKELYERVIEGQTIKKEFYTPATDHTAYNWLELNLNPIYVGTQIIGAACFGRTITDRKDAEAELCKSNDIQKQLLHHMTEIRENERALISREIHDQLGQSLTALKLDLNWLQAKMSKTPEIKEKLSGMVNIVTSTIKDVQRISSELRPGILDDLGLTAAIEWYAEEFEKRSNLIVKLDLDEVQVSNEQANLALFRVMQESLTNIIRHARAKNVQISLHEMNEHIVLDIEDDGIGMSVEKLNSIHSLGLLGMHDRVKQVGGTIDILCGSDAGTKIRICISSENISPELSKNQRL